MSRLVVDAEGQPVLYCEAMAQREALTERLASLPPLPGAANQLLHHFGHDWVAEMTGRSLRHPFRSAEAYQLILNCAEVLPYPVFYQAFHASRWPDKFSS
jgi:hypothetical protein